MVARPTTEGRSDGGNQGYRNPRGRFDFATRHRGPIIARATSDANAKGDRESRHAMKPYLKSLMAITPEKLILAVMLLLPESHAFAQASIQVTNLQAITAGMTRPVVLKVVGSPAACTYLGRLVQVRPKDPNSPWVIKAEQRSCLKSKGGDLTIIEVQALVPLPTLPVKQNSELNLFVRDGS